MDEQGNFARDRLEAILRDLDNHLDKDGRFLIVSSGAVGLGARQLGLVGRKLKLEEKQACASVGQTLLMNAYQGILDELGHTAAQVLVTADDLADRERYLNLRHTLHQLLKVKAVPVINENDSVSIAELEETQSDRSFGDNDQLSALIASKIEANLLIILTDVDGLYTENPKLVNEAAKIGVVHGYESLKKVQTNGKSDLGRGGMASKIEAIKITSASGVHTVIASGFQEDVISDILKNREIDAEGRPGSLAVPKRSLSHKKRWIGFSSKAKGSVRVNAGAQEALEKRHASLLPKGVIAIKGTFQSGDVIQICNEEGEVIGKGIANFSHADMARVQGRKKEETKEILQTLGSDVVISCDNLVLFSEEEN